MLFIKKSNSPAVREPQSLTESKKHQENTNTQIVALRKSPSIIRPLKAVAMATAFAFYAINLPTLNKFS